MWGTSSPGPLPFATPVAWWSGAQLGKVVSVQDPQSLSRVQVQLLGPDADNDAPIWARVAVPFAGDNHGAFLIPDVDQEVLRRTAIVNVNSSVDGKNENAVARPGLSGTVAQTASSWPALTRLKYREEPRASG